MKRNKGRWMRAAAMLLTLVLLMGTFTACGSSGDAQTTGGTSAAGTSAAGGETDESGGGSSASGDFHGQLPEDFKISIMLTDFVGSPNSGEYGEQVHEMLEEITGYQFEITWVTSDSYNDKVSTILASGVSAMPMIMKLNTQTGVVISAAASGAFWPIEDYLYTVSYTHLHRIHCAEAFLRSNQRFGLWRHVCHVRGFAASCDCAVSVYAEIHCGRHCNVRTESIK